MEKESLYIFKFDAQGNKVRFPNSDMPAKLGEYTYSAQRMAGTPTLTATLNYPSCLDELWTGEEFVEFRGEKYYIDQVPTSSKDNKNIMYKHELQFVSERIVLENVYFMDVVTAGADTYHSNSTSVKFMGDINEFVSRLNASMAKSGISYTVVIDDNITSDSKLVSLDGVYLADALQSIYTIYELPYYFVGKVCHIGYTENVISTPFEYRKGLVSIKKTNANYRIVNRVTGVGSSDNIPFYYPNDDETGTIERCQNLMPPIYRESGGAKRFYNALDNTYKIPGTNDYYSFKNLYSAKKVKEVKVDFGDIKPTIEGVTNTSGKLFGEIADIAFDANDSDELGSGTGNNVFNGTDEYVHSYFYIKLNIYNGDYGFNLFEQGLEGGTAVINMTTGNCAACEFEIGVTYKNGGNRAYNPVLLGPTGNLIPGDFEQKVTSRPSQYVESQQDTSKSEVWIAVKKDNTSFGVVMPNATNNYKPAVGDKFVITGIKMPKPLVLAAEKRLEEALIKYMSENNDEKFTFSVNFSRVFLADNSDLADILNENARIYIKYNSREYLMYVSSFTCKADKNCLYDISVELTDKLSANVSALRSTIADIAGDIMGAKLGNINNNNDLFAKTARKFLRKDSPDQTSFLIKFLAGLECGEFSQGSTGVGIYKDEAGNWHIETDYLDVRVKFTAKEVEIQKVFHIGGAEIKSSASMKCVRVEELEDVYRCYMNTTDNDGQVIYNRFKVNDQAYVQTFNLERQADGTMGNHFLWRLVTAVGDDYIDLSKEVCALASDAPKAFDDIVQLGYRGTDDPSRQVAVIDAGAGEGAPYYRQYVGVNSFHLPEPETQLKPGDNKLSGVVHIRPNSTGAANLSDLPDFIQQAQQMGTVNLLRNSGFTGDYKTEELSPDTELTEDSEMYSKALEFWTGMATVQEDTVAVSGRSAVLGSLSQSVALINQELYVISYKAKGGSLTVSCGDYSVAQPLTSEYQRYKHGFTFSGAGVFMMSGSAAVCDVQLERGTIATDWKPSPLDNDKSMAEFQSLSYIYDVLKNGSVDVIGGLILSSMIQLGNYKDGKMQKVTAGISGVYNDNDDVYTWGGGTFEQAIRTVMMFKNNPKYQPTEEELASIANAVITHGGRAILNDVILRGYIYALGGYFRGSVEQADGFNKMNEDGSVSFAGGKIRWGIDGKPIIEGKVTTAFGGKRIEISPEENRIIMYNDEEQEVGRIDFVDAIIGGSIISSPRIRLKNVVTSGGVSSDNHSMEINTNSVSIDQVFRDGVYSVRLNPTGVEFLKDGVRTKIYSNV